MMSKIVEIMQIAPAHDAFKQAKEGFVTKEYRCPNCHGRGVWLK
jgi:hypothetical protein